MGALKYVHSAFDSDLSALPALNNDLILCAEGGSIEAEKLRAHLMYGPLLKMHLFSLFRTLEELGPLVPPPPDI